MLWVASKQAVLSTSKQLWNVDWPTPLPSRKASRYQRFTIFFEEMDVTKQFGIVKDSGKSQQGFMKIVCHLHVNIYQIHKKVLTWPIQTCWLVVIIVVSLVSIFFTFYGLKMRHLKSNVICRRFFFLLVTFHHSNLYSIF